MSQYGEDLQMVREWEQIEGLDPAQRQHARKFGELALQRLDSAAHIDQTPWRRFQQGL